MKYLKSIIESFNSEDYYTEISVEEYYSYYDESKKDFKNIYMNLSDFKHLINLFNESGVKFEYQTSSKEFNASIFTPPKPSKLSYNSKVNRIKDYYNNWSIFLGKDEWFYCFCRIENRVIKKSGVIKKSQYHYYKCDQFEGLIQFLKDKGII
jgi:hypothetical protein